MKSFTPKTLTKIILNINITFLNEKLVKTQNRKLVHNKNVLFQKHFFETIFIFTFFLLCTTWWWCGHGVCWIWPTNISLLYTKSLFNLTFLTVLIINKVWEEKLINNSNIPLFLLNIFLEKLIMNDKHMTLSYVHIYCILNDIFM